ncbi:MAG: DUF3891 family protein [Acidobacteriota bacterium]
MIVRPGSGQLHLITQPDHAALAGRIMDRWVDLAGAERRASILRAVREHDNGWREPDAAPIVDPVTGRVADFVSAPAEVRQGVWPRGVARLADDPWAAALVAHHAVFVYDRYRGDTAWTDFFDGMSRTRDALMARAGGTFDRLAADYTFVRLGDLISLVFCCGWTEAQSFGRWTIQGDGDRVDITPDPFLGAVVRLEVEARAIPEGPWPSVEEMRAAVAGSPRVSLTGVASGASPGA